MAFTDTNSSLVNSSFNDIQITYTMKYYQIQLFNGTHLLALDNYHGSTQQGRVFETLSQSSDRERKVGNERIYKRKQW